MSFNYVVRRQEKTKICFGSGSERKLLNFDKNGLVSKHARSNMSEMYDVGPGSYDISMQTSALNSVLNKPTSKLGTVIGGRKAERKPAFISDVLAPGPKYNVPMTFPRKVKQLHVPFNSGAKRMNYTIPSGPGVGTYEMAPCRRKRMVFARGEKRLLPPIKIKRKPLSSVATCQRGKKLHEADCRRLNEVEVIKKLIKKKAKAAPTRPPADRTKHATSGQRKIMNNL